MEQWLEFEEAELRSSLPDALGPSASGAAAEPLHRLAAAVEGRHCLVGTALTLADVVVYATLLPVFSKLPVCGPTLTSDRRPSRHSFHARTEKLRVPDPIIMRLQEALPPHLRQYLKKVGSDAGVQRGIAQALGKRGEAALELNNAAATPILPIPGEEAIHERSQM